MKDNQPAIKLWSQQAMQEVAADLGIDFDPEMQDWPFEIASDSDIQLYVDLYDAQTDAEKKFVIMDMIIEANTNQISRQLLQDNWIETKMRLMNNYSLHEYQIYHWCAFDELRLADAWDISPMMRMLWAELNS